MPTPGSRWGAMTKLKRKGTAKAKPGKFVAQVNSNQRGGAVNRARAVAGTARGAKTPVRKTKAQARGPAMPTKRAAPSGSTARRAALDRRYPGRTQGSTTRTAAPSRAKPTVGRTVARPVRRPGGASPTPRPVAGGRRRSIQPVVSRPSRPPRSPRAPGRMGISGANKPMRDISSRSTARPARRPARTGTTASRQSPARRAMRKVKR